MTSKSKYNDLTAFLTDIAEVDVGEDLDVDEGVEAQIMESYLQDGNFPDRGRVCPEDIKLLKLDDPFDNEL